MLPAGIILLWHGSIVNIPTGYVLCDGNNGTPNLQDKFILGAGNVYAPGATGGSEFHTHTFTGDGHVHTTPAGATIGSGVGLQGQTNSSAATGTTDGGNSQPPYHALAYIMKT